MTLGGACSGCADSSQALAREAPEVSVGTAQKTQHGLVRDGDLVIASSAATCALSLDVRVPESPLLCRLPKADKV